MSTPAHLGMHLSAALDRSEPLGGLLQRVRESKARLETLATVLPPPLARIVRAGPLDETGWQLLVDNAAAAAKLRQFLPSLESALVQAGWRPCLLRIKVLPRS